MDSLTAGRCARGERWAFSRYSTRTDIFLAGGRILHDFTLLDSSHGPIATPTRTGPFNCFATILLLGPAVAYASRALLDEINKAPLPRGAPILFSASPIPEGIIIRAAGANSELIGRWIRDHLRFVADL